jgi:hypothetical protein
LGWPFTFFLGVPHCNTDTEIAAKLNMPLAKIKTVLEELQKMGLVEEKRALISKSPSETVYSFLIDFFEV